MRCAGTDVALYLIEIDHVRGCGDPCQARERWKQARGHRLPECPLKLLSRQLPSRRPHSGPPARLKRHCEASLRARPSSRAAARSAGGDALHAALDPAVSWNALKRQRRAARRVRMGRPSQGVVRLNGTDLRHRDRGEGMQRLLASAPGRNKSASTPLNRVVCVGGAVPVAGF